MSMYWASPLLRISSAVRARALGLGGGSATESCGVGEVSGMLVCAEEEAPRLTTAAAAKAQLTAARTDRLINGIRHAPMRNGVPRAGLVVIPARGAILKA